MTPVELYEKCVQLLLQHHWYRDGDDPGIWRRGESPGLSFGEAIQEEFELLGINMEWTS